MMRTGAKQNVGKDSKTMKKNCIMKEREDQRCIMIAKGRERRLDMLKEMRTVVSVVFV